MVKWDQNFFTGQVGGMDVIRWMTTTAILNDGRPAGYGGGLQLRKYRGLNVVEHGGADAGYRAEFMRFPDQKIAIIILGNFALMFPSLQAEAVADIVLGDLMEPKPPELEPYTATEKDFAMVQGVYYARKQENTLKLVVKDGTIRASLAQEMPLVFASPTRIRVAFLPVFVDLVPAAQNSPQKARLVLGPGFVTEYEKVEEAKPTPPQLAEYAGDYACLDLPTTYTFSVQGDRLVLSRFRFKDQPLEPMFHDRFGAPNMDIAFHRGRTGKVTGFRLHTGRSRHIEFVRGT
jgi:hypothetical protein